MNKRILYIFVFLYCVFCVNSCRCTRDFEEVNACCRSYAWIEVKSIDEDRSITLISIDTAGSIIPPIGNNAANKTTLYVDLNHNTAAAPEYSNDRYVYTHRIVAKIEGMPDVEIFIRYTKRYKLISPNLGGIEEYMILDLECGTVQKKIENNNHWLSSIDEEPDYQIFL